MQAWAAEAVGLQRELENCYLREKMRDKELEVIRRITMHNSPNEADCCLRDEELEMPPANCHYSFG